MVSNISLNHLQIFLYVFNIVFFFAGLDCLAVAIWAFQDIRYKYVELLTTNTYLSLTYIFLVVASVILVVSILGCIATWKNNRGCVIIYIALLVIILIIDTGVAISAFIYKDQVYDELDLNLNETFLTHYKLDESKTEAIDAIQEKLHCCGAVIYTDWKYSKWKEEHNSTDFNFVPDSCCKNASDYHGNCTHSKGIHSNGCISQMEKHMREHLNGLSAFGLGICLVFVLGITLACMLNCELKRLMEELEYKERTTQYHR